MLKILKTICFLLLVLIAFGCSAPKKDAKIEEVFEDYSNPAMTLKTFFKAGNSGRIDVVEKCFLDWDNVIARSSGYRDFVTHIREETQNINYNIFKFGRKDDLLEVSIEIISQKPYFRRRDFYYFDYFNGKWLIVTSGWMKNLGC